MGYHMQQHDSHQRGQAAAAAYNLDTDRRAFNKHKNSVGGLATGLGRAPMHGRVSHRQRELLAACVRVALHASEA